MSYKMSTYNEHADLSDSEMSTCDEHGNKNENDVSTASEHGNKRITKVEHEKSTSHHVSKKELKSYIGYHVKITFTDGEERTGTLGYTAKFCKELGWRKPNNFTLGNLDFKTSYVKDIRLTDKEYWSK